MPRHIEAATIVLAECVRAEARQDAIQIAPMQDIELAERQPPAPHLFHGPPVFAAPGVGEGKPIGRVTSGANMASVSRAMPVRQSTSVPNTSNNRAFTASGIRYT